MAKQIVNLRNEELRAIVQTAEYSDARAADWITRCLIERRDKIGRAAFAKVLPLDRFEVRGGRLEWIDLAAEYGLAKPLAINIQWSTFNNENEKHTPISGENTPRLPPMQGDGYWMASLTSPARPGPSVQVYVRKLGATVRLIGVEHSW